MLKMQKLLDEALAEQQAAQTARGARRSSSNSRYVFVAVPNGSGSTTSVSIVASLFDELARALGGRQEVSTLARKVAAGYNPSSGIPRSAYVRMRLQRRAASPAGGAARSK